MHKAVLLVAGVLVLGIVCGCRHARVDSPKTGRVHRQKDICDFRKEIRLAFIAMCKLEAQRDHGDYHGWAWDSSWTYNGKYEIIYFDAKYLSFRTEAFVCLGFNIHGGTSINVGTIDRKTGKVLKAADVIPECRRAEVLSALVDGVAKKLGNDLLDEPKITDNFYLADDGIHFVYNEYAIAPYALGPVEAVVQMPADFSKPVKVIRITTRPIYDEE